MGVLEYDLKIEDHKRSLQPELMMSEEEWEHVRSVYVHRERDFINIFLLANNVSERIYRSKCRNKSRGKTREF